MAVGSATAAPSATADVCSVLPPWGWLATPDGDDATGVLTSTGVGVGVGFSTGVLTDVGVRTSSDLTPGTTSGNSAVLTTVLITGVSTGSGSGLTVGTSLGPEDGTRLDTGTGVQSRNSMMTPGGNACDTGTTSLVTIHGLTASVLGEGVGTTPVTAGRRLTGVSGQGRTFNGGGLASAGRGVVMFTSWKGQAKLGFGVVCVDSGVGTGLLTAGNGQA